MKTIVVEWRPDEVQDRFIKPHGKRHRFHFIISHFRSMHEELEESAHPCSSVRNLLEEWIVSAVPSRRFLAFARFLVILFFGFSSPSKELRIAC